MLDGTLGDESATDDPNGAQTLAAVKERGSLNCGVGQGLLGFSSQGDQNDWIGLDVDLCRAIAAAIFGDPGKVKFTPLDAASRFAALQSAYKADVQVLDTLYEGS